MKKVLVVAHDAGGAAIIASYLKTQKGNALFHAFVAGPARSIFKREGVRASNAPEKSAAWRKIIRAHTDASYVLIAAPGWMTRTEMNALEAAKREGLKTVVYMDSWGDEKRRFGYPKKGWEAGLPSEFWAGDKYELAILKKTFPRVPAHLMRNQYFQGIKRRYRARKKKTADSILFMSDAVPGCETVLNEFLACLPQDSRVLIRFHPADKRARYDKVIKKYPNLRITKSDKKDIVEDLTKARAVVGLETAAMATALIVGKRTICLAHFKREAFLPYKDLLRVRQPRDAARLLSS